MKIYKCIGFLTLLVGCRAAPTPCGESSNPHQCNWEDLAWKGVFRQAVTPPAFEWTRHCIIPDPDGVGCLKAGYYSSLEYSVTATRSVGDVQDSALNINIYVHELLHAALDNVYGNADGDHTRPEWDVWLPAAETAIADSQNALVRASTEGYIPSDFVGLFYTGCPVHYKVISN